jgi:arabinose-5-phosphate isomerase
MTNYKYLVYKEIDHLMELPFLEIEELVNCLYESINNEESRIITSGMGKAGQIANTFATTLSSTGTTSYFVHPAEAQHGDLGSIGKKDVIIVFSNSGKTREILELIGLVEKMEYSNKIYAIVGKSNRNINEKCKRVLKFGKVEEICPLGLTPTTSTTCMSVISDLIVVGLMNKKKFTKEEYRKRHHGGYLGKLSKK